MAPKVIKWLKWSFIGSVFGYVAYVLFSYIILDSLRVQEYINTFHEQDYLYIGGLALEQKKSLKTGSFKKIFSNPALKENKKLSHQLMIMSHIDPQRSILARDDFALMHLPKFKTVVLYEWMSGNPQEVKVTFLKEGKEISKELGHSDNRNADSSNKCGRQKSRSDVPVAGCW